MNNIEDQINKVKIELELCDKILSDIDNISGELTVGLVLACIKGRKSGLENIIKWSKENA